MKYVSKSIKHNLNRRDMKLFNTLVILLILGILFGIQAVYGQHLPKTDHKDWPMNLKILTGAPGGQWDTLGNCFADILTASGLPSSCRLGGAIGNINRINKNLEDIGFSFSCFLRTTELQEDLGIHPFRENTALLTILYPQVMYIIIRKNFAEKYAINNVGDLIKKNIPLHFATLKKGTGSYYLFSLLLKYGYNTCFEKLKKKGWKINFNNYSEIADNFVNNQLDCFAYTAGSEVPLIISMEKFIAIKVLPISRDILEPLHNKLHVTIYTLHPQNYKSITTPVTTLSDYACLIVRKDFPESLGYEINKILWKNRKYISEDVKDFRFFGPDTALQKGVEVHPGSIRFWNQIKK